MLKIKSFIRGEDGAVTVDWVVLTAAIAGMTVLIANAMQTGTLGLTGALVTLMENWSFG